MFWPRLQLTDAERRYCGKYANPLTGRRGVFRRMYTATLTTSNTQRAPSFTLGISRRTRVFGMTASGDLSQFRLQLQDSSGEQYFPDPIAAPNLFGGYGLLPPSVNYPVQTFNMGVPLTLCPFVFEPNICLAPNQSLQLNGIPMGPYVATNYFIEIVFHIWEFPVSPHEKSAQ